MTAQNPFSDFFDQIESLLRLTQDAKPTGELPEGVDKRLTELERQVQLFKQVNEETFKKAGVSDEQIKQTLANVEKLHRYDKWFMERIGKLKQDIDAAKRMLSTEVTIAKQRESFTKKEKRVQTRQKKFRRLGGKKDMKD